MAKYIQTKTLDGLSTEHFLVVAFESIRELGWRIKFVSDAGVIAYTENGGFSWNGEITVKLEGEVASIECISISNVVEDYGHNKTAVEQFIDTFDRLKTTFNEEQIEHLYAEYEKDFLPPYEDTLKPDTRPTFNYFSNFWSYFIPAPNYFITPIIVNLNIILFIIMVCTGISFFEPDAQSMVSWGANSTTTTLDGQWWRLLTNCFLHFGVIHLLLNMYALVFVGLLLEPFVGKVKYITAYLLTGIIASLASLWWHDYTVSAGASGAIFGLYGVFLAILTTNHIEKSMRNGLMVNIGIFVVYNLVYGGFKGGIDNAAHIGGLVSGIAVGYLYVPALRKPGNKKLNQLIVAGSLIFFLAGAALYYTYLSKSDRIVYFKRIETFYKLEDKALEVIKNQEKKSGEQMLAGFGQGIGYWQKSIALLEELQQLKLPDDVEQRNKLLIQYCRLRLKSYELMHEAIAQNRDANEIQLGAINTNIKQLLDQLSSR
ncbi:rhomboid family intramembrane serine protease [Mucilaginibacter galii]|uniref:Peptidase S54 rhomboid domain-containing protein n=1 Tax=Mucilaginibacter galii TaxID=2005073 RepID=A0A917N0W3_9SPHI|nr:rhomboid family intramembrane serine protease [Mucilaginibacter galii]GGI49864.1 hypothetical protein GCM10011425_10760 [Mucilaginibacter galii]